MMAEDRTSNDRDKRLGSNYAVDLGEDRFLFVGFEIILDFLKPFESLWPDL